MKKPVRLDEAAEREVHDAKNWYEEQREGLGDDLLAPLAATLERIEASPEAAPLVNGVGKATVRSARTKKFPYRVIYMELPDRWRVIAFAHTRRDPDYWKKRLETP